MNAQGNLFGEHVGNRLQGVCRNGFTRLIDVDHRTTGTVCLYLESLLTDLNLLPALQVLFGFSFHDQAASEVINQPGHCGIAFNTFVITQRLHCVPINHQEFVRGLTIRGRGSQQAKLRHTQGLTDPSSCCVAQVDRLPIVELRRKLPDFKNQIFHERMRQDQEI
ncbi:AAEL011728-PA [Aedes aegypti]|uniref:AAEL011728-PA n=1 Tax=Aedes aegypti TaxID=7159 RepID=Q16P86_AEDAE|nr:AAEL011728-PA [Aedes aegypti]